MSTPESNAAIVAVYESELSFNRCIFAALALATYEYVVTFQHEFELLWQRRWTVATCLFVTNRYMLLANIIIQCIPYNAQVRRFESQGRCSNSPLMAFLSVVGIVPMTILALFSSLRVFALLDRAYLTAGCVLLLGMVPVGIDLFYIDKGTYNYVDDPTLGPSCFPSYSCSASVVFCRKPKIVTTLAADVVALVTTWLKTYRHVRQAASIGVSAGFGATLIQYGTLYFVVLLVVNILLLITFLDPSVAIFTNAMNVFTSVLPNIVISRFLLNLRQVDSERPSNTVASLSTFVPNIRIPTLPEVIGNLGEPLVSGDEVLDDDPAFDECLDEGCCDSDVEGRSGITIHTDDSSTGAERQGLNMRFAAHVLYDS
ncbi:hypothetical protein NM688_g8058 [Phlebia brevispora]|uniref:Uncharacterized protein n=1 Tax=Phlebia brevispora TaxID=194682 RepID=A0ACC1RXX1_9APHY|nr:hypothetical protein NM688_g8058 [Phlebia brevispora]